MTEILLKVALNTIKQKKCESIYDFTDLHNTILAHISLLLFFWKQSFCFSLIKIKTCLFLYPVCISHVAVLYKNTVRSVIREC